MNHTRQHLNKINIVILNVIKIVFKIVTVVGQESLRCKVQQ